MDNIKRVVIWFSAGAASAVAAKMAIAEYSDKYPIVVALCDTGSEHEDNARFADDVADWLGVGILVLRSKKYSNTIDVFRARKYIVGVAGAPCTLELKKKVRRDFEDIGGDLQVFGYTSEEVPRWDRFLENNPLITAVAPLIEGGITKDTAFQLLAKSGIHRPITYDMGFQNANCLAHGCVKGQMGYWNHYRRMFPAKFDEMAKLEREIGAAINKKYVNGERIRVFLDELDPNAGNYKTEPAFQCSLFCGVM